MPVLVPEGLYERMLRVVRWGESEMGAEYRDPQPPPVASPCWVKTTSGTATNGWYPAHIIEKNGTENTWEEGAVVVRVQGANGEALTGGVRYGCRPSGPNDAGEETYTLLGTLGGALAVREEDGVPTYAGVTTLTFSEYFGYGGFVLAQPAAGEVRVRSVGWWNTPTVDGLYHTESGRSLWATSLHVGSDWRYNGIWTYATAGGMYFGAQASAMAYIYDSAAVGDPSPTGPNKRFWSGVITADSGFRAVSEAATGSVVKAGIWAQLGGALGPVVLPRLGPDGADGSLTVIGGLITAYTAATGTPPDAGVDGGTW